LLAHLLAANAWLNLCPDVAPEVLAGLPPTPAAKPDDARLRAAAVIVTVLGPARHATDAGSHHKWFRHSTKQSTT
jgi:hypothetical protein